MIEEKRAFHRGRTARRSSMTARGRRPKIIGKRSGGRGCEPGAQLQRSRPGPEVATILERVLTDARPGDSECKRLQRWIAHGWQRLDRRCSACRTSAPAVRTIARLCCCPVKLAGGGTGCHGMGILMPETGTRLRPRTPRRWAAKACELDRHVAVQPSREHVFQNLGDGTYFHSGSLAVQAASPPR